jgi:hypothetical protein
MGKKQTTQKRSRSGEKTVSWDEAAKHAEENNGNLPNGRIESPYGRSQVDAGNMQIVEGGDVPPGGVVKTAGGATGDDGNMGSTAAGATRGGARD